MPNFRAIKIIQKALNDITQKNRNISYGMFVFVHSSHHLEWEPFSYLVVIVTTLETPKNILNQLQHNFTLSADLHHLHGRDMRELSRIFRLFWIPKKTLPKKILARIFLPIKIPNSKISNPLIILAAWNPEDPLGAYVGSPHLNVSRPLVLYGIIINFMVCLSKFLLMTSSFVT